jgi:hypothetical protein
MNKKTIEDLTKAFNAAKATTVGEKKNTVEELKALRAVIKGFDKTLATDAAAAYVAGVEARKAASEAKKAEREAAFALATAAKEEAKTKLAAAKALVTKKPRGKKAKDVAPAAAFKPKTELIKKAKKDTRPATTVVVDNLAGGLADLPDLNL